MKRTIRVLGLLMWFAMAFVVGVYWTFPMDDLKPALIGLLEAQMGKGKQGAYGVDPKVEVGSLSLSGIGVKAERVMIQLASRDPDPGPTIDLEELAVGVRPWSLLGKATTVSFDADLYGGDVEGVLSVDDKGSVHDADVEISDLDLKNILPVQALLGVPIGGMLNLRAKLDLGATPEKDGSGAIKIDLKGATLGPGNLKMLAALGGFELPAVDLGNLKGEILIKQGKGTLTGLKLDGKDVQAELTGDVMFKGRLLTSRLDIDGWFALTPPFLEREKKFQSLLELGENMGGFGGGPSLATAKDAEGHYWFSVKGATQNPAVALSRDGGKRAKQKAGKGSTAPPAQEPAAKPDGAG